MNENNDKNNETNEPPFTIIAEYLSLQDAAMVAKTTVSALRQAIKRGRLPAIHVESKHGQMYGVLLSDLESYMKGRKNPVQKRVVKGPESGSKEGYNENGSKDAGDATEATKAILDELRLLRATVEQQAFKIGSLEQEVHDTKSQLASQLGQLQRALPATSKGWFSRLWRKSDS